MNSRYIIKIISISLASISFAINLLICSHFVGFSQGWSAGNDPTGGGRRLAKIISHANDNSMYEVVAIYIIIAFCFSIYVITKLIEKSTLLQNVIFVPLIIIVYTYWQILYYKNLYLEENGIFGYSPWIISSIPFDWFCLFIAVVLLIVQVITLFILHFNKMSKEI